MKRMWAGILAMVMLCCAAPMPALADVSASTRIYEDTDAYLNNVDLAIMMMDGVQVDADDVFSFNDVVGPRTADEGYQLAINGRGARVRGGGVSQVATTLYLALKKRGDVDYIEKMTYGSNFTGGYVESGYDAIVTDYANEHDFSFLNMGATFTIEMYRSGKTIHCSIEEEDWDDDDDDWDDDDDDWDDDDWDDEYIFPQSSHRRLTRAEISAIPESMWGYARNEIYARHGYRFQTKKYRDYFSDKDWYSPGGFSTDDLNEIEWYNMELIKSMEQGGGSGGTSSSFIFPDSNRKRLTRRDILGIAESQWGYARNEIYARHGYEFKTKKYRDYFAKKRWYSPGGFDEGDLNDIEWYNMDLIKSMEKEYGVD